MIDREVLRHYNSDSRNNPLLSEVDLPEPFIGNPESDIYILMDSPGLDVNCKNYLYINKKLNDEKANQVINYLNDRILLNLKYDLTNLEFPFISLDPEIASTGHHKWWKRVFQSFIDHLIQKYKIVDRDTLKIVSHSFFNVELYGYHSTITYNKFLSGESKLPTIDYSVHLINKAIDLDKIILIPRAASKWFKLINKLATYDKTHFVATNRSIVFSSTTISPSFYKKLNELIEDTYTRLSARGKIMIKISIEFRFSQNNRYSSHRRFHQGVHRHRVEHPQQGCAVGYFDRGSIEYGSKMR